MMKFLTAPLTFREHPNRYSGVKSSDKVKVKSYRYDVATDKIITEDLHWENAANVALPAFSVCFIVL